MPPLRPRNFSTRIAGVDGIHPTKNVAARMQSRATHKKTRGSQNSQPKQAAAAAKKRSEKSSKLQFSVPTIPQVNASTSTEPATPSTIPVVFPRQLPRPPYKQPSVEAITSIGMQHMLDADPLLIRETVDSLAPGLMAGLHNFTTPGFEKNRITPTVLLDFSQNKAAGLIPPTHMLAIRSKTNAANQGPPSFTLYPAHSMVLAANCASLPPFPAVPPRYPSLPAGQFNVPVWQLVLPSAATYPQLSHFLYTKNTTFLLNSFLPKTTIPTGIASDPSLLAPFAAELAETFTVQLLMKHMMYVYGLWQNTVALGIFVEPLWQTIELMWKILLTAVSIAKGYAHEMLDEEQLVQLQQRQASNAAAGPMTLA
ncbi:hypothetical protein CVT24_007352 [Panaeolus cyanescens]|uniref:Uncharacterized protein n=1 Tax=Panaeolus cyanescens TaxID=181874 RepID=A0A409W9T7_9AGAR|nr:hypothetical protein CVT24_007352 [Panaeolus cyanescens]